MAMANLRSASSNLRRILLRRCSVGSAAVTPVAGAVSRVSGFHQMFRHVAAGEPRRCLFTVVPRVLKYTTTTEELVSTEAPIPATPQGYPMYFGGLCKFPDNTVEALDTYIEQHPLVMKVKQDRLIIPRGGTGQGYIIPEAARVFIWNGVLLPFILHSYNISSHGLFTEENFVVMSRLGTPAFKEINSTGSIELTHSEKNEDIKEALIFFINKACATIGIEISDLPEEIQYLYNFALSSPDGDQILTDPALLPRESRGVLILRIFGFIKELLSRAIVDSNITFSHNTSFDDRIDATKQALSNKGIIQGPIFDVLRFYSGLPYTDSSSLGPEWTTNIGSSFLKPFIGRMGLKKLATVGLIANAQGLLWLHRNAVVHWMDEDIIRFIKDIVATEGLVIPEHNLHDVLDLLHYEFPLFLREAVRLFRKLQWDSHLDLWSLFASPLKWGPK